MKLDFSEKNVLVTGASKGIGKALSLCFAKDKANLVLTDLPSEMASLQNWAKDLEQSYGIKIWTFFIDLTNANGPESLYRDITDSVGTIHTLVNNAGICWYGQFEDMPQVRLEKMILLNCMAYAKLIRLFLPSMIKNNAGAILNVSSVAAFQPLPSMALYGAVKAFNQSLSEAICNELPRKSNVVVATLNPPFTKTALIKDAGLPDDFIPFSLSLKDVSQVAALGYNAFKNGKTLYVLGWQNKLLHLYSAHFLPRTLRNKIAWLACHRWSDFIPFKKSS